MSGDTTSDDDDDDPIRNIHAQVAAFARVAGPDAAETSRRDAVKDKIATCVSRVYPSAMTMVFGSGATGLALKDADIDLVILGVGPRAVEGGGGFNRTDRGEVVKVLRKIKDALSREKIVWKATLISTAKVPIVKMHSGAYAVDLSVGSRERPRRG